MRPACPLATLARRHPLVDGLLQTRGRRFQGEHLGRAGPAEVLVFPTPGTGRCCGTSGILHYVSSCDV
eukprot:3895654-Karenia_brevis.AAC.1